MSNENPQSTAAASGASSKGIHLDFQQVVQLLGILMPFVPETVNIKGRRVPIRATLNNVLADGKVDAADVLKFVTAFITAPHEDKPALPDILVPHLDPHVAPTLQPIPASDPDPSTGGPDFFPDACSVVPGILYDAQNNEVPYTLQDKGDHFQMVRSDGVESITGRYRLILAIGYEKQGFGAFRFEDHDALHLYNTAAWEASGQPGSPRENTRDTAGPDGRTEEGIVNWARYNETNGMDPVAKFPEPPSGQKGFSVVIRASAPNGLDRGPVLRVYSKPIWTPPVR